MHIISPQWEEFWEGAWPISTNTVQLEILFSTSLKEASSAVLSTMLLQGYPWLVFSSLRGVFLILFLAFLATKVSTKGRNFSKLAILLSMSQVQLGLEF